MEGFLLFFLFSFCFVYQQAERKNENASDGESDVHFLQHLQRQTEAASVGWRCQAGVNTAQIVTSRPIRSASIKLSI